MAAPTGEVRSTDFVVTLGGNIIAARTGGSMEISRSLLETTGADSDKWYEGQVQQRSIRFPFQSVYVDNSVKLVGCPTLKISDTGGSPAALEQLKNVRFRINTDQLPIENCGTSDNADMLPDKRTCDIDFVCDYQDPANSNNQEKLWDDILLATASTPGVDWEFEFGTGGVGGTNYPELTGSGLVTRLRLNTDQPIAQLEGTIRVTGAVTFTDGAATDTALLALIRSVIPSTNTDAPSSVAIVFAYDAGADAGDTGQAGSTTFTATCYVPTLEIGMGYEEPSSVSAEFVAAGGITKGTAAT